MARDYVESFAFLTEAEIKEPLPISIGLSGGSGTGKTYSALMLASGMADALAGAAGAPIAFIDTENRRGLHYRDAFPQILRHYVDFGPVNGRGEMVGYPPERWIALIDAIEASGVKAGVIDSFSHAWEGINGVLDLHAAELERLTGGNAEQADKKSQLAWAAIKPRYRRLINRIIRSKVNWVICTRAKPVMQARKNVDGRWIEQNARKTKTRRADVPWDVAADGDLIFEMTAMAVLDPEHPGWPRYQIKVADQFKSMFRPDAPLSAAIGREMAEWSRGRGSAQIEKALMDEARDEARKGKAAFTAFWQGLDKPKRGIVWTILDECRETAEAADARPAETDDPFGLPPDDPSHDPDDLKRAEDEALAYAREQEQGARA